jgi:hypothetical protein
MEWCFTAEVQTVCAMLVGALREREGADGDLPLGAGPL